jgi:glycosyltransferase involved in cell wall biosynthesis
MRRPHVVYWNNIPTPYTIARFAELARRDTMDFEAWFTYPRWHDREWELEGLDSFPHRFLPSVRSLPYPAPLLGRHVPDLLVSQYGWPWFVAGWALAKARRVRHVLECEITFDTWAERRWWKELAKRAMFRTVDGVLVFGAQGAAYAHDLGAAPNQIHHVDHVFDVDRFVTASKAADRAAVRARLGLRGTTFAYVGRLWWGKGLDTLLAAYERLGADDRASLLIVGSGPEEDALRRTVSGGGLANVVFAGFRQQAELPELYAASDVLVFPTLGDPWGLVVEEAMASGLPVVSSRSAGEIGDRIRDGETGWIVPAGDVAALADRLRLFVDDPALAGSMGGAARDSVRWRTPARWADEFESLVGEVMAR